MSSCDPVTAPPGNPPALTVDSVWPLIVPTVPLVHTGPTVRVLMEKPCCVVLAFVVMLRLQTLVKVPAGTVTVSLAARETIWL